MCECVWIFTRAEEEIRVELVSLKNGGEIFFLELTVVTPAVGPGMRDTGAEQCFLIFFPASWDDDDGGGRISSDHCRKAVGVENWSNPN